MLTNCTYLNEKKLNKQVSLSIRTRILIFCEFLKNYVDIFLYLGQIFNKLYVFDFAFNKLCACDFAFDKLCACDFFIGQSHFQSKTWCNKKNIYPSKSLKKRQQIKHFLILAQDVCRVPINDTQTSSKVDELGYLFQKVAQFI